MSLAQDAQELPLATPEQIAIANRCAHEGIPMGAIARVLRLPFEVVNALMKIGLAMGSISAIPRADWPPSQHWDARLPSVPRTVSADDVEFGVKQQFRLTNLEAGFLLVLLRYQCAEKEKLHGVIEAQRAARPLRPDDTDGTDPKMVDVMICKLRKKLLAADPALVIYTSWGKGYFLDPAVKELIYQKIGVNKPLS
jgi:hypothetical protein